MNQNVNRRNKVKKLKKSVWEVEIEVQRTSVDNYATMSSEIKHWKIKEILN